MASPEFDLVTIKDYGRPEYLDGAQMQYCIMAGEYPRGQVIAYCDDLTIARYIAQALSETVHIIQDD